MKKKFEYEVPTMVVCELELGSIISCLGSQNVSPEELQDIDNDFENFVQ